MIPLPVLLIAVPFVVGFVIYQAVKERKKAKPPKITIPSPPQIVGTTVLITPPKSEKKDSTRTKIIWTGITTLGWLVLLGLIAYWIVSCTERNTDAEIKDREARAGIVPTQGRFHWRQSPEGLIGGQRIPDEGSCDALVLENNGSVWRITMSDNQNRVGHYTWCKTNDCGTWTQECPSEGGTWWLEKVAGRGEYRGWMTGTRYPGQKLIIHLQLVR